MWRAAPVELVREVLRESEETLRAQVAIALAADQRAMQIVSSATTLGAGVLAAVVAWASVKTWDWPLLAGLLAAELCLMIAILLAIRAARPADLYVAGSMAKGWSAIDFNRPESLTLGIMADHYSEMIAANSEWAKRNGSRIRLAMMFFGASPFAGLALGALTVWAVSAGVVAAV